MKKALNICAVILAVCFPVRADFVPIGYAGNTADSNGRGDVAYGYSIGKYAVTLAEFQSAVAGDSRIGVGSSSGNAANKPVIEVTWYEAAKYCNYLTTGDAYTGLYQFDGSGTLTNTMTRTEMVADGGVFYAMATSDEWYKAAYFKADGSGYSLYANGSSDTPVKAPNIGWNYGSLYSGAWAVGTGAEEQNGTYDMMGNVWERVEDASGLRFGGQYNSAASYLSSSSAPLSLGLTTETSHGFRIVEIVPEPSTTALLGLGGVTFLFRFMRRKI